MEIIELNSVGCVVNENGITFPMNEEATNTGCFDNEDGGVHIMECVDEWWENMTCEDGVRLFQFLAETDIYLEKDYFKWAMNQMDKVVEANGFNSVVEATIQEGWSI